MGEKSQDPAVTGVVADNAQSLLNFGPHFGQLAGWQGVSGWSESAI